MGQLIASAADDSPTAREAAASPSNTAQALTFLRAGLDWLASADTTDLTSAERVAVHSWGWQLVLNPDGTTTATSPDGRRVLHSHAPPAA